jgi:hypothetical protein
VSTPDEPTWSDEEIEARRDQAPAQQQPVPDGVADVSQDPDLFPLNDDPDNSGDA